jgi:hypothetical protein
MLLVVIIDERLLLIHEFTKLLALLVVLLIHFISSLHYMGFPGVNELLNVHVRADDFDAQVSILPLPTILLVVLHAHELIVQLLPLNTHFYHLGFHGSLLPTLVQQPLPLIPQLIVTLYLTLN